MAVRPSQPAPSQAELMRAILLSNPGFTFREAEHEFYRRHKLRPNSSTFYNVKRAMKEAATGQTANGLTANGKLPYNVQTIADEAGPEAEAGPGAEPEATPEPPVIAGTPEPAPASAPATADTFVPPLLLSNIRNIKLVCDSCGGLDVAERVAQVINDAGGVANFLAAIELLRETEPAQAPTTHLPSDLYARG